jgi:hypothetical protein
MKAAVIIVGIAVVALAGLAFSRRLRELMVWRSRRVSLTESDEGRDGRG